MSRGYASSFSLITPDDETLVAAIRGGDERALSQLYRQHWPMVSHFVLQNSGTEADAQDVYQEGVMVFYEKVRDNSLELNCQIKTYLYAVCRRIWLKRLTSRSRFGVRLLDNEDHDPPPQHGSRGRPVGRRGTGAALRYAGRGTDQLRRTLPLVAGRILPA